jgi:hypothetical protein
MVIPSVGDCIKICLQEADSAGIWLLEGFQVGSGVSQVHAAFCTTIATV